MRNYLKMMPIALGIGALAGGIAGVAQAQPYPTRPIKIIVDTAPGGVYDIFTRALADEMQKKLGQPVIVEPRPGGGMIIATRACAEAPPDGYTLCGLSNNFVLNEFVFKTRPYSFKSLLPVTNVFYNPLVIVANAELGARTIDELVALAKRKPGTLSYSVPSGFQRALFDHLNRKYGTDFVAIPFKSGADTLNNILSGIVPIAYIGAINYVQQVKAGKVFALAFDGPARSPLFPGTPTLAELGYTDHVVRNYYAMLMPAGTPQPIVDKIYETVTAVVKDPVFHERQVAARAYVPVLDTPQEFARFLERDLADTAEVAKKAGIEPQ